MTKSGNANRGNPPEPTHALDLDLGQEVTADYWEQVGEDQIPALVRSRIKARLMLERSAGCTCDPEVSATFDASTVVVDHEATCGLKAVQRRSGPRLHPARSWPVDGPTAASGGN